MRGGAGGPAHTPPHTPHPAHTPHSHFSHTFPWVLQHFECERKCEKSVSGQERGGRANSHTFAHTQPHTSRWAGNPCSHFRSHSNSRNNYCLESKHLQGAVCHNPTNGKTLGIECICLLDMGLCVCLCACCVRACHLKRSCLSTLLQAWSCLEVYLVQTCV